MNRRSVLRLCIVLLLLLFVSGCSKVEQRSGETDNATKQNKSITPTSEIISLADGLSTVNYTGDYGFNDFLKQGSFRNSYFLAMQPLSLCSHHYDNRHPNSVCSACGMVYRCLSHIVASAYFVYLWKDRQGWKHYTDEGNTE